MSKRAPLAHVSLAASGVVSTAFVLVAALAAPAAATPLMARSRVWTPYRTATSLTVCAEGWVDDPSFVAGAWEFVIAGTVFTFPGVDNTAVFLKRCHQFDASGPAGWAAASLTFTGVSTSGDVTGACGLTFGWAPGIPINEINGYCINT